MKCSVTSYYKGSFSEKSCAQVFKRAFFFCRVNCHVMFEIVLLKILSNSWQWNALSQVIIRDLYLKSHVLKFLKGHSFFYRVNCHVLFEIVLLKISLLLNKTVHSFIGFFARTVIVEKWWLCSILSHKMGLQGHFYYMIKQSAFNIRKDSLANR